MLPGIVELMAISMVIGFFNLINSIFGVCFVIRNKIDVPASLPRRASRSYSTVSISLEQAVSERKRSRKSSRRSNRSDSGSPKKSENLLNGDSDGEGEHNAS